MDAAVERPGARWWVPERPTLHNLQSEVQECKGCELYLDATQGVMGAGPADAELMVLGEQPGDQEDLAGEPFVGPAGKLLAGALSEAGIEPDSVFRTNVVKHFRFSGTRGKQRIHKSPSQVHVAACGPWLAAELDVVRPTGVLVLGSTAGKALYGPGFRVGEARGEMRSWPDEFGAPDHEHHRPEWVLTTTHPSAVLRSRRRDEDYARMLADLRVVAEALSR
jgi:uracil-DNA glycosylase family protein